MQDEEEILKKIHKLMNEQWEAGYVLDMDVRPESHFKADLNYDSLDTVELLMKVEKEFEINIPDGEAVDIETVADMINSIQHHLARKS